MQTQKPKNNSLKKSTLLFACELGNRTTNKQNDIYNHECKINKEIMNVFMKGTLNNFNLISLKELTVKQIEK